MTNASAAAPASEANGSAPSRTRAAFAVIKDKASSGQVRDHVITGVKAVGAVVGIGVAIGAASAIAATVADKLYAAMN